MRHQSYTDFHQESRFARKEEVMQDAKKICLKDKSFEEAGIPLMVSGDEIYVDSKDHHNLILGATGSGKTRRLILILIHLLLHTFSSLIVVDVKGQLKRMTSGLAKKLGWEVVVLDLREFKHGECWNPLAEPYRLYHSGEKDLAFGMLSDFMDGLAAKQDKKTADAFWPGMAKSFGNAILQLMVECLPENLCNVTNFVELCSERNFEKLQKLSRQLDYASNTAAAFRGIYSCAEKTRQSIEVSLFEMIKIFTLNTCMTNMMSNSTFDLHQFGKQKTIVYIEIADEKPTFHAIASMFIKQIYEVLVKDASEYPEETLPVPVHFVIDEFCNIPKIENMANMITAARSRNIFLTLVVQSYRQLVGLYGDDSDTIKGNCQNWYYLFSREYAMLEEISKLCGEITEADGTKRKLISVSELQRLKMGEMLVMHDRLYPYVTYFPDISEYKFEQYPPIRNNRISKEKMAIVDIEKISRLIRDEDMPIPFSEEIPAIDRVEQILRQKEEERRRKRESEIRKKSRRDRLNLANAKKEEEKRQKEMDEIQKELEEKFNELFGTLDESEEDPYDDWDDFCSWDD